MGGKIAIRTELLAADPTGVRVRAALPRQDADRLAELLKEVRRG